MLFLAPSLIGLWIYQLNNCKSKIYAIFWVFKVFRIIYTKEFDEVGGHVEELANNSHCCCFYSLLFHSMPHIFCFLSLLLCLLDVWVPPILVIVALTPQNDILILLIKLTWSFCGCSDMSRNSFEGPFPDFNSSMPLVKSTRYNISL